MQNLKGIELGGYSCIGLSRMDSSDEIVDVINSGNTGKAWRNKTLGLHRLMV